MTVVFADLVGFTARAETLDPEDVEAILSPYHARLRSELERFGGTVEKFIGDAVMAVFGAPVAREDDPERAVRAAIAIRDWATEGDDLDVRIAVATGEALVSLDARPESGEAMVAGDVVNTAARLQSAAPVNGILVGEATRRATSTAIDYVGREPVSAKGKTQPIPVWEAVAARARFGIDPGQRGGGTLTGRDEELSLLVEALGRARRERSPQLLTLIGVPGIGKSRLVYELFKQVERGDELTYWRQGRALPYGEGVTLWALSEIVKAHTGVLETDGAAVAEQKLRRALAESLEEGSERDWVERHLRPLLGLAAEGELPGDRRSEALAAWRRFFEALAEHRPLVLVFEDLHWADDGVLDFIDHLVEWASGVPILVVCTARPELLDRRSGWGGGKRASATVSLSPLSDDDTARLVHELLSQSVLPAETQSALLARAGGNPLYAEEFVLMLDERGDAGGALPESVQGIIAARLDLLAVDEKELLQDAAVVGKVFCSAPSPRSETAASAGSWSRRSTDSSAGSSWFASGAPRSPARVNTRSATSSSAMSPTVRSRVPRAARSTSRRQAGSKVSRPSVRRIAPRCWPITISPRSTSLARLARVSPPSRIAFGSRCALPATAHSR